MLRCFNGTEYEPLASMPTANASLIAHNRFGFGLAPDEAPTKDPRGWLERQLESGRDMPSVAETRIRDLLPKMLSADAPEGRRAFYDEYRLLVRERAELARTSKAPFIERLVHFWTNHFAISANKKVAKALAPGFEFGAIRPHVTGTFEDLLMAAETHPAMLIYLDQSRSVGPKSPLGLRRTAKDRRNAGLNENLAREILELHSMGVRSGYQQEDVVELARALTGFSVTGLVGGPNEGGGPTGTFVFDAARHEPGERRLLGKTYPAGGIEQARAILHDIARHPATARFVATKLSRHFIADSPPSDAIDRIANAFLASDGALVPTYRALVAEEAAWRPGPSKFKNPWEWTVSALRTSGIAAPEGNFLPKWLETLGQATWEPASPAGFADEESAWLSPDPLVRRADFASALAVKASEFRDVREIAQHAFQGTMSENSRQAIAGAGDPAQALALLLMSPEFLWR